MYKNPDRDERLISSLEIYFRNGDSDLFLKEASGLAWTLSQKKYHLDDDSCAEIVLKLVHDVEHIMKVYQEGKYCNFPAFLTAYIKHLILNQRKKNVIRARMEIVTDEFYTDRFPRASDYDFTTDILNESDEISSMVRDALNRLDPLSSLIIKMKHRIPPNLREFRILSQRLKPLELNIKQYFRLDQEEETINRIKKRKAEDQLKKLFQSLHTSQPKDRSRWQGARQNWFHRHSTVPEEKSFRKIAYYLGMSQHKVRSSYYSTIANLKKNRWEKVGWKEAA
ncbi:RNA polymerase subunit sigma-70 [Leptospira semungkisensis]|uniref:RNA polymerase subunit sigma-70 n=1 Tax=Leptospira semungkisensis TaxID=2484985 RepID=A0A4R9G0L1_9LEPT|nr:RNA polymerase subunit sigma-70 [Leptospira semungkisensis]TGK04741.1 RNA polymerase subunit sigma-70 [Leptospira semungkisensis]